MIPRYFARKVITIGLGTVTFNPRCVALICAAGEAKAQVVKQAVEDPHRPRKRSSHGPRTPKSGEVSLRGTPRTEKETNR